MPFLFQLVLQLGVLARQALVKAFPFPLLALLPAFYLLLRAGRKGVRKVCLHNRMVAVRIGAGVRTAGDRSAGAFGVGHGGAGTKGEGVVGGAPEGLAKLTLRPAFESAASSPDSEELDELETERDR